MTSLTAKSLLQKLPFLTSPSARFAGSICSSRAHHETAEIKHTPRHCAKSKILGQIGTETSSKFITRAQPFIWASKNSAHLLFRLGKWEASGRQYSGVSKEFLMRLLITNSLLMFRGRNLCKTLIRSAEEWDRACWNIASRRINGIYPRRIAT